MNLPAAVSSVVSSRDLSVSYQKVRALHNVSVDIPESIIMGIVGPNGSGKSTLMKAMLGLVPASGSTEFFGLPLNKVRTRVGYMPQHSAVDWQFPITVDDVVLMGTYGHLGWVRRPGAQQKQKAAEAMEAVGITNLAHRQIGELSGGQRQRAFLARTLAAQPDVYFMDEPFQGIDHVSQEAITAVMQTLHRAGKTIVIVHHDLNTVPDLCDHVTLLSGGQLISSGPVEESFTKENVQKAYGTSSILF